MNSIASNAGQATAMSVLPRDFNARDGNGSLHCAKLLPNGGIVPGWTFEPAILLLSLSISFTSNAA
jgi:hypothetical protein